ncbi:MAG: glycosyltransferase family 2 protein [Anaerolineales bacterium]|nr:glycosyltransferase family 2 protein [Anaerolineales bacterium]
MAPRVSVVIPTRNRADYVLQALDSVFAQTFTDYEIIVVDDGSTDNTADLLHSLAAEGRLHYFVREPQGVSAARNFGVQQAQGKYIAFLDSDDLFMPTKLEEQMAVFDKNPELGFVHCWFSKFTDAGQDLGLRDTSVFRGFVYPQILTEWSVLMAMPCLLIRKDVFLEAGGFDEGMRWAEDLDLWRRVVRKHSIDLVPESLVRVRVHPHSTSYDKTHASEGFVRYMHKAEQEDASQNPDFWRRAWTVLYINLAQNLLGEGGGPQMQVARQHLGQALRRSPLSLRAWAAWAATWLPAGLRRWLIGGLRKRRYPANSGSL